MYLRSFVSKMFYALILSPLQPGRADSVSPGPALSRPTTRAGWTGSIMNVTNKVMPGLARRLSNWMFHNNRFPWEPGDLRLIAFGSGAAVLKWHGRSGTKALRIYRKSLGKSPSGLLQIAEYYKKNYETVLAWYGGPLDLVLPMQFLVVQGLPLVGPVAASLQPYIQAERTDILEDFSESDFVDLMKVNPFLRDQFRFFVEQTLCQWDEGKICYDFVGRENLMLVKQAGGYRLKIVDVGFFKFDLPEFNLARKLAQIEKKVQRLKYLYQLTESV